jgi:phasin family protein
MQTGQEFIAAVNKSGLGLALAATEAAMAAGEQVARLQMESAKSLFQESVGQARKLAALKDVEEAAGMMSAWSKDGVEKLSGYSRNYVAIAQEAQRRLTKALDESGALLQRETLEMAEKAMLHSPVPGGEGMLAGMKLVLTSATNAIDTVNQMMQQVTEFAGAGLKAASLGADVIPAPSRKRAS